MSLPRCPQMRSTFCRQSSGLSGLRSSTPFPRGSGPCAVSCAPADACAWEPLESPTPLRHPAHRLRCTLYRSSVCIHSRVAGALFLYFVSQEGHTGGGPWGAPDSRSRGHVTRRSLVRAPSEPTRILMCTPVSSLLSCRFRFSKKPGSEHVCFPPGPRRCQEPHATGLKPTTREVSARSAGRPYRRAKVGSEPPVRQPVAFLRDWQSACFCAACTGERTRMRS